MTVTVVKIGGSLAADASRLRGLLAEYAAMPCVIVPGGGVFADAVRASQAALGFGDALAHRLALDAMGRMAEIFCALEPRLAVAHDPATLATSLDEGRTPVWDPVALKMGHPDIPETWDVTSDSLAVWLATALGAPRCVFVKSAPAPAGTDFETLGRLGLVDAAFARFAARYPGEIVLRGPSDMKAAA